MVKAILFDIENTLLCAERAGMDCAWVDIGLFEPEDLPAQPRWTLHALAELAAVTAL